jgi:hypothetical protein
MCCGGLAYTVQYALKEDSVMAGWRPCAHSFGPGNSETTETIQTKRGSQMETKLQPMTVPRQEIIHIAENPWVNPTIST